MKRFILTLVIFAVALACCSSLKSSARSLRAQFRAETGDTLNYQQQLTVVSNECAHLTAHIQELKHSLPGSGPGLDLAFATELNQKKPNELSPDSQTRILTELRAEAPAKGKHFMVTKAALAAATLRPFKGNSQRLTDAARDVLAVTPDEQRAVENTFTEAIAEVFSWAAANLKSEGPSSNTLVRYIIPADPSFAQAWTNKLATSLSSVIGEERTTLLTKYFTANRYYTDSFLGQFTNILAVVRVPQQQGLFYEAGWRWDNNSTVHTPMAINERKLPLPFSYFFPGGWQEIAQREGFELPADFLQKP